MVNTRYFYKSVGSKCPTESYTMFKIHHTDFKNIINAFKEMICYFQNIKFKNNNYNNNIDTNIFFVMDILMWNDEQNGVYRTCVATWSFWIRNQFKRITTLIMTIVSSVRIHLNICYGHFVCIIYLYWIIRTVSHF